MFSDSPPSEDFQNLLKGLLNKNPDKRSDSQTHNKMQKKDTSCSAFPQILSFSSVSFLTETVSWSATNEKQTLLLSHLICEIFENVDFCLF